MRWLQKKTAATEGTGAAGLLGGRRDVVMLALTVIVTLSWLVLWLHHDLLHFGHGTGGGHGGHAGHGHGGHHGHGAGVQGASVREAGLFIAGWTLMSVAMMLPTSLPLIQVFRRLTARRRDHLQLVGVVIVGYTVIWAAVGVVAYATVAGWRELLEHSSWLRQRAWAWDAGILLIAGLFQFSSLKYRCLDKCRTPRSFVMQYWSGQNEKRSSLALGLHHGVFCVGCCWALMLLMLATATSGFVWMLILAAIMAAEKNTRWGRALVAPLGIALVAWALWSILSTLM